MQIEIKEKKKEMSLIECDLEMRLMELRKDLEEKLLNNNR